MKTIIYILPISDFIYKPDCKVRDEIEFYSDGTKALATGVYYKK